MATNEKQQAAINQQQQSEFPLLPLLPFDPAYDLLRDLYTDQLLTDHDGHYLYDRQALNARIYN